MRFVLVLLAALAAPCVSAQTVRRTTGTLAVGQRLAITADSDVRSDFYRSTDPDSFHVRRTATEEAVRSVVSVATDRVMAFREVPGRTRGRLASRGGYVDTTAMDGRMFPLGTAFEVERADLRWGYTRQPPDTVGTLYGEAFDVAWLGRTAHVGQAWSVSQDSLRRMLPGLLGDGRLTVRLDSVGRFEGRAAAFLSFAFEWSEQTEADATSHTAGTGRVVRWPELGHDVVFEKTYTRSGQVRRSDGYRATSVTTATHRERRALVD